jgi:cobalamin biosynthesis protein CbiG
MFIFHLVDSGVGAMVLERCKKKIEKKVEKKFSHLFDSGVGCWRGVPSDALRMCLHVAL